MADSTPIEADANPAEPQPVSTPPPPATPTPSAAPTAPLVAPPACPIRMSVGGQDFTPDPDLLGNPDLLQELQPALDAADGPAVLTVTDLLALPDKPRWDVFRLVKDL